MLFMCVYVSYAVCVYIYVCVCVCGCERVCLCVFSLSRVRMDLGGDFEGAPPPDEQALPRPDARADLPFGV